MNDIKIMKKKKKLFLFIFTFLLTTCTIIIRIPTNEIPSIIKKSTPHIRSTFSSKASRI